MDSLAQALLCVCFAQAVAIGALLFIVREANRSLRSIAQDAIIASRAVSAEDFAAAQIGVKQAEADRATPIAPGPAAEPEPFVTGVRMPDGRILQALRPMG